MGMSTREHDESINRAVAAYLDYLEGEGPRPDFGDLSSDVRSSAVEVINLLLAGRGVDVNSETPSFRELLAGTEFDDSV